MNTNKKLHSVTETGKLLGIGRGTVYDLIKHGYLPALDLGGLKVPDAAIDDFIKRYIGHSFKNIEAVGLLQAAQ